LDGSQLTINAELIEFVESKPDTVVSLTTGRRVIVRDPVAEVIKRVVEYRRQTLAGLLCKQVQAGPDAEPRHG
jgi:flagellar protein FlbD